MPVTIKNATIYSINNGTEMAYEIEYSEGTKLRSVVGTGMIRNEYVKNGVWVQSGKAYVVDYSRKRQAERVVETVKAWVKG